MMNPGNYGIDPTAYQQQLLIQQLLSNPQTRLAIQQMLGNNFSGNMGQMPQMTSIPNGQNPQVLNNQNNNSSEFTGTFTMVDNFEQVKGWPVPIGGMVILMEKNNKKFYIKSLDTSGNPLISTFRFEEYVETPKADIVPNNTQFNNIDIQNSGNVEDNKVLMEQYLELARQIKENQDNFQKKVIQEFNTVNKKFKQLEENGNTSTGGT